MSELTIVSFESETFGNSYVSELSDGPPFTVHGIALGAGDVTVGQSGIKKKWPAEELEQAADSLKGTDLVEDHQNDSRGVVGRVTKSGYKQGTGVVYEAELFDEELAQKIKNGLLEVSIRGYHADVDNLKEDDETDAKIVEDIEFDNLSIVPTGASPSNTLQMGEHDELSAAALSQFTDTLDRAELAEIEPGMWVTDGDMHGITISQVQDGNVEVDIYEEMDGEWRSTEQTEMMDADSLDEWDVDEDNIGAVQKDENSEDSDEEEMESDMSIPMPDSAQLLYDTEEKAMEAAKMMGLDGIHEHDFEGETWYMPGEDHAAFEKAMGSDAEENASLIKEGMTFFSTVNNSDLVVTDVSGNMVTVEVIDGDSSWQEETDNIIRKLADGDWEHSGHMDMDEMAAADASYSQGDWVRWDTRNSTEIGTVVGSYEEGDDIPDIRGSRGLSPEGDDILYTLRMYKERDGAFHPIKGKPIGHYEKSVRSAEKPANVSESSVELGRSNVADYDVEDEDWVQWYPSDTTEEHGFVVDVDESAGGEDETIVTIEVWTQNSDGEWETDGEEITKSMEEVEPWGNFPRKQEDFADAIEDGDPRKKPADNEYAEENAQSEQLVSEAVEKGLKNKVEEHNDEHGDEEGKRVTYRMLKNVYERGMGAYNDTHREGMTQQQWSYARVNAFLYLVRNGNPENDQYVQDNDLLPEDHPKYDEDPPDDDEEENASLMNAPDWEEGQMVEWQVNPEMKGKIVHVDHDKKIIMVEVMEDTEEGMMSSGFTVTAGYSDLTPVSREMNAVSSKDVPMQDHPADHDSNSVNSLMRRFVEEYDGSSPSLDEFVEWMEQEELEIERGEGEEKRINSKHDLQDSHEEQPHRYIDAEDEQSAELGQRYDDYPEAASENAQMALDAKEDTGNPNDCGRETGWKRARQLANGEGVTREQLGKMSSFNRHRQNSEMDSEEGRADCGWMMWKAWGGDEGVDWAQEKLDSIEEEMAYDDVDEEHMFSSKEDAMEKAKELDLDGVHEMDGMWMPGSSHEEYMDAVSSNSYHGSGEEDEDEMTAGNEGDASSDSAEALQEYEMHEPDWSGTTEREWNSPDMEDFNTDDLGEIANHFLISESGFPPENYGDLKLPIVEPNGDLNVNALAAVKGGRGASAVDGLSDQMEEKIDMMMNELANDEFDRDWGMEENAVEAGRPTAEEIVGGVRVLSGDDLRNADKSEESDSDSLETYNIITMTDSIEEKLSELSDPVAVEADEVEELRNKADRFEEMSENLEALRERTDILDEVDRSQVEALAEADDPVVEESDRYEELQSEAEQVAGVYAAELAEEYPAFSAEELTDKFSIEELREKFESEIGDVQDELASSDEAEPRSQDADEESLEQAADDSSEETETEELSDEVAQKQEEIRNKILN
jgi:hypothetical protein